MQSDEVRGCFPPAGDITGAGTRGAMQLGRRSGKIVDLLPYGRLTVPISERHFCHLPVIYLPLLRVVSSLVSAADEVKAAPSPLTCRASFPLPDPESIIQ